MFSLRKCTHALALSTVTLLAVGTGCTDSGLEPAKTTTGQVFDDELRITGEVCLTPPSDASFPVKVLFVVDTSDSMSVTDRSAMRNKAVSKVLERYRAYPGVKFGVIAFDSRIDRLTKGFTDQPDMTAIGSRLSSADRLTDYQGALGAAYQMISEDIVSSSPAERARSKYVVVFFSDGTPDPQCSARVTPCGAGECPAHQHCRATVCKDDYLICTVPRKEWETAFNPPIPPEMYPELGQGADYNQPSQILRSVDDILGLQDFYRVGEIRLHTGFLYDPEAASDPLAIPFGLDRAGGVELMTAMAEHGMGTFTEFTNAANIDFLSINYTSFKEENDLALLLATNLSVIDTGAGIKADSDRDGLIDDDEIAGKTCVANGPTCADALDSDGDGYTDFFEEKNRISGFDPLDPNKPLIACGASSRVDSDGDLLRDCEEDFLKTDFRSTDTDGDRIPDGIEFRLGMDPLDPTDAFADPDRDDERNIEEVKTHTNPNVAVSASHPVVRYLYDVEPFTRKDGKRCYQMDVRHIKLLTTGKGTAATRLGINRVVVYFDEVPVGRAMDLGHIRTACVDVRYLDGQVKSPQDGWVRLQESDFTVPQAPPRGVDLLEKDLAPDPNRDPTKHCLDHTSDIPDAGADSGNH
jgi:hypothetical protein